LAKIFAEVRGGSSPPAEVWRQSLQGFGSCLKSIINMMLFRKKTKSKPWGCAPRPPLGGRKVRIKNKRKTKKILETLPPNLRRRENLPPDPHNSFNLKKGGGLNGYI